MYSFALVMELAFIAQGHTRGQMAQRRESVQDSMDNLVDRLVHKMFDRVLKALPVHQVHMDGTALQKPGHRAVPSLRGSPLSSFSHQSFITHRSPSITISSSTGHLRQVPTFVTHALPVAQQPLEETALDTALPDPETWSEETEEESVRVLTNEEKGAVLAAFLRKKLGSMSEIELSSMVRLDFMSVVVKLLEKVRLRRANELILTSVLALPSSEEDVHEQFELVEEFLRMESVANEVPGIQSVIDVRQEIRRMAVTTALEPSELLNVQRCIKCLAEIIDFCWSEGAMDSFPRICSIVAQFELDPDLLEAFEFAFEANQLNGTRFPEVGRMRKELARIEEQIASRMESLMSDSNFKSLLAQDGSPPTSIVNGRIVVNVARDNRKKVGVVQGISDASNAYFVEPREVVGLQNKKNEIFAQFRAAETKVVRELSIKLMRSRDSLLRTIEAAAELDAARAKAVLGHAWKGVIPKVKNDGHFNVTGLKNPALALVSKDIETIGNDLSLDMWNSNAPQGILISGPNGGGKTVAMKAVALAALLVRLGVPIPAGEESRVDIFNPVLAVVGDAQSVEEKVSTFQAHCLSIKGMLGHADPGALLIFDEIGSGTDPKQGSVIAQAVIEECLNRDSVVMATTHYSRVKDFAVGDERLALGAMVLDEDGGPTFRLMIPGVGQSHGIETAKRMFDGEFENVVDRAKSLLDKREKVLSDLMLEIEERMTRVEVAREELSQEKEMIQEATSQTQENLGNAESQFNNAVASGMKKWREELWEKQQELRGQVKQAQKTEDLEFKMSRFPTQMARGGQAVQAGVQQPEPEPMLIPLGKATVPPGQKLVCISEGAMEGKELTCVFDKGKKLIVSTGDDSVFGKMEMKRDQLAIPVARPTQAPPAPAPARQKAKLDPDWMTTAIRGNSKAAPTKKKTGDPEWLTLGLKQEKSAAKLTLGKPPADFGEAKPAPAPPQKQSGRSRSNQIRFGGNNFEDRADDFFGNNDWAKPKPQANTQDDDWSRFTGGDDPWGSGSLGNLKVKGKQRKKKR